MYPIVDLKIPNRQPYNRTSTKFSNRKIQDIMYKKKILINNDRSTRNEAIY